MNEKAAVENELNELFSYAIDLELKMGRSSVTEEKILGQGGKIAEAYKANFMGKYDDPVDELLSQAQKAFLATIKKQKYTEL